MNLIEIELTDEQLFKGVQRAIAAKVQNYELYHMKLVKFSLNKNIRICI